jgi:DNA-binding IclR family transcriptional regulator
VGFAEDLGETTPEIACLAAPIQTPYSAAAPLSVGIAVPNETYGRQREAVKYAMLAVAKKISTELLPGCNREDSVIDNRVAHQGGVRELGVGS